MKRGANCPECSKALKTDYLYTGGYCWGCGKGFGERRGLASVGWGAADDSHLDNIEKWLRDEYRTDDEIQDMIKGFALNKRTFGNCILGYLRGLKVLKAEIKRHEAVSRGISVRRMGEKVVEVVPTAEIRGGEATPVSQNAAKIDNVAVSIMSKKRGRQSSFSNGAHKYVGEEWPKFNSKMEPGRRCTYRLFFNSSEHRIELFKLGIKSGEDVKRIWDCIRKPQQKSPEK